MILDPSFNLHLPFGKSCPTRRIVATFHDTSPFPTWRIIPVSKWLVTMVSKWLVTVVSKSPKWGYSPYKCPKWDDPPSMILLQSSEEDPQIHDFFLHLESEKKVNWCFGARVVWIPNGSPYVQGILRGLPRFDSQTTGPQTTIVAKKKLYQSIIQPPLFQVALGSVVAWQIFGNIP